MNSVSTNGNGMSSEFTSGKDFNTNRSSHRRWILSHAMRHKIWLILFVVATFANIISQAIIPSIVGTLFADFTDGTLTRAALYNQSLNILILGLLIAFFVLLRIFVMEVVAQRMERDTRDELYSSLLGKSLTFHDKQTIGDIMSRTAVDVRQINLMMNPGLNLVFASAIGLVIPFIFIGFIDIQLLIIPALFILSYFITLRRYNNTLNPWSFKTRIAMSKINGRLNEAISGMPVVRSNAQEDRERQIFRKNIEEYRVANVKLGSIQARYYPWVLLGIATALAIFHGIVLVRNETITLAEFVAFVLLFQLFRFPTFINIFAITAVTMGIAGAKRILELLNGESLIDSNPEGHRAAIRGEIIFENVTFAYTEGTPVIKNIDFEVAPGQTVAIVGMTGSGKTTVTKLLNRLYVPQKGRILIDGINIQEWSIDSLRSQMAVVEQDVFLFTKSVRDNITLGLNDISDEEVVKAAKLAQAHNFILEMSDGYDTKIGERGITLSGGQRQRLAIARAVIRDPKILILDDASSAIDSKTEDEINRAIREVLKNRVSFLITHRIAQIRKADLIILMDQGMIIDKGNHDWLIAHSAKYRQIFSAIDSSIDDGGNGKREVMN